MISSLRSLLIREISPDRPRVGSNANDVCFAKKLKIPIQESRLAFGVCDMSNELESGKSKCLVVQLKTYNII